LRNVIEVCRNTFRETVRDRVLYVIVVFSILIIALSKAIGWVSVGEDIKVIKDVGLAGLSAFGALIAIFVGTGLIYKEIDKRTIYTILSRPVRRVEFLLGKYLGLLATVSLALFLMMVFFVLYLAAMNAWGSSELNEPPPPALSPAMIQALVMLFFELALVTAVATLFSSASSPILSAVFTFVIYASGRLAGELKALADLVSPTADGKGSWLGEHLLLFFYSGVPTLHMFNLSARAAHDNPPLGVELAIPASQMIWTIVYGLSYAGLVLVLAALVFRRRDF